jgi:hypothetical protein
VLHKTALRFRDRLESAIVKAGEAAHKPQHGADGTLTDTHTVAPDLDLDLAPYDAPECATRAADTATVAVLMEVSGAYRRRSTHLITLGYIAAATLGAVGSLLTRRR